MIISKKKNEKPKQQEYKKSKDKMNKLDEICKTEINVQDPTVIDRKTTYCFVGTTAV